MLFYAMKNENLVGFFLQANDWNTNVTHMELLCGKSAESLPVLKR